MKPELNSILFLENDSAYQNRLTPWLESASELYRPTADQNRLRDLKYRSHSKMQL
jgi:hypothetical protein